MTPVLAVVCVVAAVYGIWRLVRPLWREAQRPDVRLCKRCRSDVLGSEVESEGARVVKFQPKTRVR